MQNIPYSSQLLKILIVAIAMVASYRLTGLIVHGTPFEVYPTASLIFLPAFVKLTAVLIFNWVGLVGIVLGTLYIEVSSGRPFDVTIFTMIVFGCAPMFAFIATKKLFNLSDSLTDLKYYHIIILSMIAACFGILNGAVGQDNIEVGYVMAIGDFVTDMVLLFSLSIMLRGWEFFNKGNKNA